MANATTIRPLQAEELERVSGGLNLEAMPDGLVSYEAFCAWLGFPIGPWTDPLSLCY